jgi:S1-C subfamily serine protease
VTIPNATVNRVVDELLEKGHIARPYLGLAMQPVAVPEALRGKVKDASSALLVVHVEKAGPAEKAGVQLGDIVAELHGQPSQDTGDILDLLGKLNVGDTIKATVLRGGSPVTVTIKLEDRPR